MSTLFAIGRQLVSEEELSENARNLESFRASAAESTEARFDFEHGSVGAREYTEARVTLEDGSRVPWTPIGPGKPLTVEIRQIYTGKYPHAFGRKDFLVTSSVKAVQSFQATARAIQTIQQRAPRSGFIPFHAVTDGTPLVYHSPAVVDNSTIITLEMVIDAFPSDAVDQFGGLLQAAGGIPVFAPASAYLLGGGAIVKLVSKLIEALVDGKPVFTGTQRINFETPGFQNMASGYVVLANQNDEDTLRRDCEINEDGKLVKRGTQELYRGEIPYITLSLDGRDRPDLKKFAPTLASAAVLDRFFHAQGSDKAVYDALMEGMKLYNDWSFREKAAAQAKIMRENPDKNSEAYKRAKQLYDAYQKNMVTDLFKQGAERGGNAEAFPIPRSVEDTPVGPKLGHGAVTTGQAHPSSTYTS